MQLCAAVFVLAASACSTNAQTLQLLSYVSTDKSGDVQLAYNILHPMAGDAELVATINSTLAPLLVPETMADESGEKNVGNKSILETVKWVEKNYFAKVKEALSDFEYEGMMMPYSFAADLRRTMAPKNVVGFMLETYEETGGVHGMPFIYPVAFDMQRKRVINYDDIFADKTALLAKVKEYLSYEYGQEGLASFEEYSEGIGLPETHTVGFDAYSIVLQYQAYEIGPYAAGRPTVHIPYADALPLMNDYGRRLCSK